jgi:hypothetical protein
MPQSPDSGTRRNGFEKTGNNVAKGKSVKKPPADKPRVKAANVKPQEQAKVAGRAKPA